MQLTVVTWNDQVVNIQVRSYRQTGAGKARLHFARSCTREHVGWGPRCSAFSWPVPGTAAFQGPCETLVQAHGMTWGVAWRAHLSCHTVCRTDKHLMRSSLQSGVWQPLPAHQLHTPTMTPPQPLWPALDMDLQRDELMYCNLLPSVTPLVTALPLLLPMSGGWQHRD